MQKSKPETGVLSGDQIKVKDHKTQYPVHEVTGHRPADQGIPWIYQIIDYRIRVTSENIQQTKHTPEDKIIQQQISDLKDTVNAGHVS
jgi:hypothetical protein